MEPKKFIKDQVYENVYFIFIDASGHSNIVSSNPKDLSSQAFDLLYDHIKNRLSRIANKNRCEIAIVWSWLGDGGMIAVHDGAETTALNTTLGFVQDILEIDLPTLKKEFANDRINGMLHIRIAVHKGTLKYTDEGQQGFIHSTDINWCAHLEKATQKDSIALSKDVYDVLLNDEKNKFVSVGLFEGREVYVYMPGVESNFVRIAWKASYGFNNMELIQCYLERLSQNDKAELIDSANHVVIDFGTTLNTCSGYLFSTERPMPYRDAVIRLLERGGSFICYMLSPNSSGSHQLMELRKENTDEKLLKTMERFKSFKLAHPNLADKFDVYQFEENPNLAAMIIDPDSDNSVCLYSPYLNCPSKEEFPLGRADMPHYLASKNKHKMYKYILDFVNSYIKNAKQFL